MSKFATKADRSFENRLSILLMPSGNYLDLGAFYAKILGPGEAVIHYLKWNEVFEADAIEKLFNQYGGYLEMTGEDGPVKEARTFEFVPTSNGGARKVTTEDLIAEAHKNMQDLGDNLMEAFHENYKKKEE